MHLGETTRGKHTYFWHYGASSGYVSLPIGGSVGFDYESGHLFVADREFNTDGTEIPAPPFRYLIHVDSRKCDQGGGDSIPPAPYARALGIEPGNPVEWVGHAYLAPWELTQEIMGAAIAVTMIQPNGDRIPVILQDVEEGQPPVYSLGGRWNTHFFLWEKGVIILTLPKAEEVYLDRLHDPYSFRRSGKAEKVMKFDGEKSAQGWFTSEKRRRGLLHGFPLPTRTTRRHLSAWAGPGEDVVVGVARGDYEYFAVSTPWGFVFEVPPKQWGSLNMGNRCYYADDCPALEKIKGELTAFYSSPGMKLDVEQLVAIARS